MTLTPSIEFRKATAADYSAAILNRETTWGEFHHGMLELGWWNSLPGQLLADARLPSLASTGIENDPAFRTELLEQRLGPGLAYGNVPPPERQDERSITERSLRERGIDFLDEDAWRASPFFREGLPYEPYTTAARAAAVAEIYDKNRWREQLLARRNAGALDWTTGFIAAMAGSLPDPTNLIAFQGLRAAWALRATTRLGRVGRTALVGAGENVAAAAVVAPALAASMPRYGDDYGWGDLWLDLAAGAGLGGVLAGGAAAWRERGVSGAILELERRQRATEAGEAAVAALPTPSPAQAFDWQAMFPADRMFEPASTLSVREATANIGWHEAQNSLFRVQQAAADLVDLGRVETVGWMVERARLSAAYSNVMARPDGNPWEVLATVSPEGMTDFLVHRGAIIFDGSTAIVKGRLLQAEHGTTKNFGLVKIIYRQGERSANPPDRQVMREHIAEMPRILREFEPLPPEGRRTGQMTWAVRIGDQTATIGFAPYRGQRMLVNFFVKPWEPGDTLSAPKDMPAGPPGLSPRLSGEGEDTAAGISVFAPQSQGTSPAPLNVSLLAWTGKPAEPDWPAAAKARLAEPETSPVTTGLDEDPDVQTFEALRASGALTEGEIRAFDAAKAEAERMADVEKAYDAAVLCALRII